MTQPPSAQTITLHGPDALAFAQAQFASKVTSLRVGQWQFSAWLDPQGRVRVFFHLARLADDKLLLVLRGGRAASIAEALGGFRFRARLDVAADDRHELATAPALPLFDVSTRDERIVLGCGTHAMQLNERRHGDQRWRLPQLREGWPWLSDDALTRWLPPALSLQRLGAVVTDKGCYPGQEIVARMHFRNAHKQHLHCLTSPQPVPAGHVLRIAGNEVGRLIDVVTTPTGTEALAVMRDDQDAEGGMTRQPFDDFPALRTLTQWPA